MKPDADGNTLLHNIALKDDVQMMSGLCQIMSMFAQTVKNKDGKTAAELSKSDMMRSLLKAGSLLMKFMIVNLAIISKHSITYGRQNTVSHENSQAPYENVT